MFNYKSCQRRRDSNHDISFQEVKLRSLQNKKALIISSSGGHLLEAKQLCAQLGLSFSSMYVTNKTSQSMSVLADKNHTFVKLIKSRDWLKTILVAPSIYRLCKGNNYEIIISTGAAIAISALPAHFLLRIPFYYFESLTRQVRPSFSGRILQIFPTIQRYSESADKFSNKWKIAPSILKSYAVDNKEFDSSNLRILVTVGTIPNFRFDRLVENLLPALKPGDELYWQLGCTDRRSLPGIVYGDISNSQLINIAKNCDVVISHCGIGTIMDLLSIGVRPLVCPRRKSMNEHVDDHQLEAAASFEKRDLVKVFNDKLTRADLELAAKKQVIGLDI